MKTKSSVLVLSAILALLCLFQNGNLAQSAVAQITFVQTPAQQRTQGQSGLSPEKKRSLSKYGPEDAFPGAREQEGNQKQPNRAAQRKFSPAPETSPTTKPAPSPAITPSVVTAAATSPTPALRTSDPGAKAISSTEIGKSQSGNPRASVLVPVTLSAATLLVFGAFIYVVGMLRKKLKQEN
jgi:hypothetical protein